MSILHLTLLQPRITNSLCTPSAPKQTGSLVLPPERRAGRHHESTDLGNSGRFGVQFAPTVRRLVPSIFNPLPRTSVTLPRGKLNVEIIVDTSAPQVTRVETMSHQAVVLSNLRTFTETPRRNVQSIPEYDQSHFFLIAAENISEQLQITRSVLEARLDTRITIFTRNGHEDHLHSIIINEDPTLAHPFLSSGRLQIRGDETQNLWAQDFGEPVRRGDTYEFLWSLPPPPHLHFSEGGERSIQNPMSFGFRQRIPIFFMGGDITQTIVHGIPTVVVGQETLDVTRYYYSQEAQYLISDEEIRTVIQRAFGVQNVILLSYQNAFTQTNGPPRGYTHYHSEYAFHIDQYTLFPAPGVVIMPSADINLTAGEDDPRLFPYRENLVAYRDQLQRAGFRVIEIPNNVRHIQNFQSYTNGIPLRLENGRTRLILPSFPDSEVLESRIRETLQRNGFEVQFIRNLSYHNEGNTHCLTGSFG